MKFSIDKLKTMQKECIRQFTAEDQIKIEDIKKIAGFDITYDKDEMICAGIVIDAETFEIIIIPPIEIDGGSIVGENRIKLNELEAIATAKIINRINKGYKN